MRLKQVSCTVREKGLLANGGAHKTLMNQTNVPTISLGGCALREHSPNAPSELARRFSGRVGLDWRSTAHVERTQSHK